MIRAFAMAILLICSGLAVEAQNLQPSASTSMPTSSAQVIVARASISSPDSAVDMRTNSLGHPVTAGTPNSVLAVVPRSLKSLDRPEPSQREIRTWRGLLLAEHSAAIFDAWTTRESLISGNGYERNPLMKPFADSAAIYPALQVTPVGFDFLSHAMMRSRNPLLRKTWWLPQATSIAASIWCGSRNIRVANLHR
jgi:hypothetical protein